MNPFFLFVVYTHGKGAVMTMSSGRTRQKGTRHIMKTARISVVLCALTAAAAPAFAQTSDRPWSVSFDVGTERALSGDLHGGSNGTVLGLPTQVAARTYNDIYGMGFQWTAGLGYAISPSGELRARFSWAKSTADRLKVGTVANFDLLGQFDDDKSMGFDVGYLQYLGGADRRLRPYVGVFGGVSRVDAIKAEFTVPAASVTLPGVDMYEESTVPVFGANAGLQARLSDGVFLQVGADLRWRADLSPKDGLAGTGLEGINDKSRRWSLPISAGLTIRF